MFGKTTDASTMNGNGGGSRPASSATIQSTGIRSFLGPDLIIVGDLESHGLASSTLPINYFQMLALGRQ